MKKGIVYIIFLTWLATMKPTATDAQDVITGVISAGIKRAIKAVDLKVQRLQTNTIWLQNAQKVVENAMAKLHLQEISEWAERQRSLYADYFDELWKVKNMVAYYHKIKEIIDGQKRLVE